MSSTGEVEDYKEDFWRSESSKFATPHYRLRKLGNLLNRLAGDARCTLLDVGCGPAALGQVLRPNVDYYGIDIAITNPGPHFLEVDILDNPITFADKQFDLVVGQGVFEYLADTETVKFAEIAELLNDDGKFVLTYTNFGHRSPQVYHAYSNVRPLAEFKQDLSKQFSIDRCFPTSYNWHHGQPNRQVLKAANMHLNWNVPILGPMFAVEYFFVCSRRSAGRIHS